MKHYVNPKEKEHYEGVTFEISLFNYDSMWYIVHARHAQEALDMLVDYLEEREEDGHLLTDEEVNEMEEQDCMPVFAGNHSRGIDPEHLQIREVL